MAVETVVILLLVVLVAGLLRSHADIVRALHELGIRLDGAGGHPGPATVAAPTVAAPGGTTTRAQGADLVGATPHGDGVAVTVTGDHETLLAFLSSGCLSCRGIWEALAEPGVAAPAGARVVVVTQGEEAESPARVAELAAPVQAPVVMSSPAWDDYDVPGAPYFVLVDGRGRVAGEGSAARWEQVVDLMERARADERVTADAQREQRNDRELLTAGIGPGDPRLYFPAEGEE